MHVFTCRLVEATFGLGKVPTFVTNYVVNSLQRPRLSCLTPDYQSVQWGVAQN